MKIAIVNDMPIAREAIRRVVVSNPALEIAWMANDGAEGVQQALRNKPDLILMDLHMPVLDGVQATRRIMAENPCQTQPIQLHTAHPLIAIGASTGGPAAIAQILATFPKGIKSTIIVVQHIDYSLAGGLAQWLSEKSGHRVQVASPGHYVQPGEFLLSGTNDHMVLSEGHRIEYKREPEELNYRPSVNQFFESLNRHWREPGIAVLLTGMGADGATGLLELKKSGWITIAQDQSTSVVYGMPREAAKLGAASHILPIDRIGTTIREQLAHHP
jgi:two-component system response regulator WspF